MADLVDPVLEDGRWEEVGIAALAERAARAALDGAGLRPEGFEISLLACDDARIAALNGSFRGRDAPTNVLSWPSLALGPERRGGAPRRPPASELDEPVFLGDVAIAYETCAREAEGAGLTLADHAVHLILHGVLHLLGHDHEDDEAAARMEAIETKALATLGVADPYSR